MPIERNSPVGYRVIDFNGRAGHIIADCGLLSANEVAIMYDDDIGHEHVRIRDLQPENREEEALAPWEQELLDIGTYMRNLTPFVRQAEQAIAQLNFAGVTTNPSPVITEETQEQGEAMPPTTQVESIVIPVQHTSISRQGVFNSLGLTNLLLEEIDEANWTRHLETLRNSLGEVRWNVTPGVFSISDYPQAYGPDGRVGSRLEYIKEEDAVAFVMAASNNRITIAVDSTREDRRRLKLLSSLEDDAWTMFTRTSFTVEPDYTRSEFLVPVRGLSTLMTTYREYISAGYRRDYIQMVLRNRRVAAQTQPVSTQSTSWDHNQTVKLDGFLRSVKSKLKVETNSLQQLPILPAKTLSSRTWGIEIEAVDILGVDTPAGWELKGDGSLRNLSETSLPSRMDDPRYNGTLPVVPLTDHTEDCEINTNQFTNCGCGYHEQRGISRSDETYMTHGESSRVGEWNSPVLRSFHSRGLKYISDKIEHRRTNNSAGVHVHVGASDLTAEQVIRLSMIYSALEPLFEAEYKRGDTRTYCKAVDIEELINRFTQMKEVKGRGGQARDMRFRARYWTVNLKSLPTHGTIEFRSMGPIYNYDHLVRWAYLCREMVNIAKANVPQSAWSRVRTMRDLVTLFSKYGKETPTPEWAGSEPADDVVATVVAKLGSENRRLPHMGPLEYNPELIVQNDDYTGSVTQMRNSPRYRLLSSNNAY